MTPTNTPREEALAALEEAFKVNHGNRYSFNILDLWGLDSRTDEAIIAIGLAAGKYFETIRTALSQPAPIEGLDDAIKLYRARPHTEEDGDDFTHEWFEFKEKFGKEPEDVIHEAARAYAKGRTQSMPDGWKLVPIEPTPTMLEKGCDAFCNESLRSDPQGVKDKTYIPVREAMLSAAPQPESEK